MNELQTKLTVEIPIKLDPKLSPNARVHWATRHRVAQEAKGKIHDGYINALYESDIDGFEPPVKVTITRHYSGRANPLDDDNLIASFKPFRDGLAMVMDFAEKDKDGRFRVGTGDEPDKMIVEYKQIRGSENKLVFEIEQVNNEPRPLE